MGCSFVSKLYFLNLSANFNFKHQAKKCKVINLPDILENMEKSGDTSEVLTALKSIDLNSKENTENTGCFLCQKPDPVKKCSKSHSRCKGKLFCNKTCELSFHKSEKSKPLEDAKNSVEEVDENKIKLAKEVEAAAKAEKAKLKKAKKKDKKAISAEMKGSTAYNNTFL